MKYKYLINDPLSLRLFTPVEKLGFRKLDIDKRKTFSIEEKRYNHILFLLEGEMTISCNEFIDEHFYQGHFLFIPISADTLCFSLKPCKILQFTFESIENRLLKKIVINSGLYNSPYHHDFSPLPLHQTLEMFFNNLFYFIEQNINKRMLNKIKSQEFFILLLLVYDKKDMFNLFYPIISNLQEFRIMVLRNYPYARSVEELATKVGIDKKKFIKMFVKEFHETPYQWLLAQKAKHILFNIVKLKKNFESIRKEFGFRSPSHFTRFCKKQLSCTPVEIRKRYRNKAYS